MSLSYVYSWSICYWHMNLHLKCCVCVKGQTVKMWLFDLLTEEASPRHLSALLLEREPALVRQCTDDRADSSSCLCRAMGQLITVNTMRSCRAAVPLKEFIVHTGEEIFLYAADSKSRVSGIQNIPPKTNGKRCWWEWHRKECLIPLW